jgi:hypothetical protein
MYAAMAADMAAEATDPGSRATLLEIAQTWRNLADKEEQSQPQPDDEKDK